MKTWLISLPLVCVVGIAMADAVEMEGSANQPPTATERNQIAKPKHPPRGDLRHCLDLKTNQAIIRCAEKKPGK
jgi:hypothetical protein